MLQRIKDRGIFKTHDYVTYKIAPTTENENKNLPSFIQSFTNVISHQLFKEARDGQPVIAFEFFADADSSFYAYSFPAQQKEAWRQRLESSYVGAGIRECEVDMTWRAQETLVTQATAIKPAYFPFASQHEFSSELFRVTDHLVDQEKVLIQVLIEPLLDGWQEELERAYLDYLHGKEQVHVGGFLKNTGKMLDKKLTSFVASFSKEEKYGKSAHREIKDFKNKIREQGFHVSVRLLSQAKTYDRRNDLIEAAAAVLKASNYDNQWRVAPILRKKAALERVRERKIGVFDSPLLLGARELQSLLQLPSREILSLKLERMKPNEEHIEESVTKDIIPIGKSISFKGESAQVGFSVKDPDTACKARLWVAPPASGKTTAVKIFVQGAMDHGHGGSVFDVADGNLYYGIIDSTPQEKRNRLVLVNFTDEKHPHVFNFDSLGRDADTVGLMFAEFFEIFYKTAANHRMNSFLRKVSMTTFTDPDATFLEMILLMKDEDFRRSFLPIVKSKNPDLYLWWKSEFPKVAKSESMLNEILQPILYRLDNLQYNPRLGPIFCGKGGRLEISRWMDEGKWVLYNLSGGTFLEVEQRMIMSFLNYAYWSATLERESKLQRGIEPIPHHKMFDEPQTYMTATPVTKLSISKSRKYRVSDNFLIQNPSQVKERDPDLWSQIIGMMPHIVIGGGLDNDNIKEMASILGVKVEDLKRLEELEFHWYMKTYVGKSAVKPFIFDARQEIPSYGADYKLEDKWRRLLAPVPLEELKTDISSRNLKLTKEEYLKLLESFDDPDEEEGIELG